jgi:hypothetical protein
MAIHPLRCVAALADPSMNRSIGTDTIVATLKPSTGSPVRAGHRGDRKVLIAFRLNDMKIDPYIRTKGERAGNRPQAWNRRWSTSV